MFGEIDFNEIEYRSEYRHTKAVFAATLINCWQIPRLVEWLFRDGFWMPLLGGSLLALFAVLFFFLFINYRSRVVVTSSSITLRRPLLADVEIAYSEIGEIEFNGMSINGTRFDGELVSLDLSEACRRWAEKRNSVVIQSADGKKKIRLEQSLENFNHFCDDLSERMRKALDRYQGYAKGTSLRQPGRYQEAREKLAGGPASVSLARPTETSGSGPKPQADC